MRCKNSDVKEGNGVIETKRNGFTRLNFLELRSMKIMDNLIVVSRGDSTMATVLS